MTLKYERRLIDHLKHEHYEPSTPDRLAQDLGIPDDDRAEFLDRAAQLGHDRGRVDAGRLREHRPHGEPGRVERAHPVAQVVADPRPGRGHLEVADVVGHETRPGGEHRDIGAPLVHEPKLVALDGLADVVIGDREVVGIGGVGRVADRGHLPVAPLLELRRRGRVVAVAVDDHAMRSARVRGAVQMAGAGHRQGTVASAPEPGHRQFRVTE